MPRAILSSSLSPEKGNLHFYYLPKGMLEISVSKVEREGNSLLEVNAKERIIPDPDKRYYLQYHANPYSDDKLDIVFTPEGYLKKLDAAIEDKSIAILDKVVSIAEEAAKVVVGVRGLDERRIEMYKAVIDPFSAVHLRRVNDELAQLSTGLEISLESLSGRSDQGAEVSAESGISIVNESDNLHQDVLGIVGRPVEMFDFIARSGNAIQRQMVALPHPNLLHLIHIPSTRFVANKFLLECNDTGYPVHIHLEKPSQALAIMDVPLRVVRAIAEIPAKLFQFRINYNNEKAKAEASESALLKQREAELAAAKDEVKKEKEENKELRQKVEAVSRKI